MNQQNVYDMTTLDDILLYVERDTGIIFEAKFFDDYVLLRPASPDLYQNIRKESYQRLALDYEDFCGNRNDVLEFLYAGRPVAFTQEKRR